MLLCDRFFAPLTQIFGIFLKKKKKKKKKKNLENSRTILSKFNIFEEQHTSHWIVFKRLRPKTVTRPRDVHVTNDDLTVSLQHS